MGEITDAIAKAIKSASLEADTSVDDDRVKQAMANIGMPVENYDKQTKPQKEKASQIDNKSNKKPSIKKTPVQPKKDFMNEPVHEDSEKVDEICCKISGNQLVLMIPKGAEFVKVEVAGTEFDTLTVEMPDVKSTKLQILSILGSQPVENPKQETKIERVPIFLDHNDEDKKPNKSDKKPKNKPECEVSGNLEDLKRRKSELDSAIKQARTNGDDELVDDLRKQRRKIRNEINKLEV